MISNLKWYLIGGMAIFILVSLFYIQHLTHKLEREKDVSEYYKNASEKTDKIYRDKDSLWHIQSEANIMSMAAFKKIADDHSSQIYELTQRLGVKPKNTLALNTTTIENSTKINIKIKDTTINNSDTISLIRYSDKYINITGIIRKDIFSGSIIYTDSLDQIVYKERARILGIKMGKVSYKSEIISRNQNTRISSNSFTLIKR